MMDLCQSFSSQTSQYTLYTVMFEMTNTHVNLSHIREEKFQIFADPFFAFLFD